MQLKQRKTVLATGKEYQGMKVFFIDGMVLLINKKNKLHGISGKWDCPKCILVYTPLFCWA